MPNSNEILREIKDAYDKGEDNALDVIRHNYISKLHQITGRNVIAYYSGWLHIKQDIYDTSITEKDKNAFMLCIHKIDKSKGLDLILHTPGGEVSATESLVEFLHLKFGKDIRCIVPQLAMSAGAMIAMSCKEIMMGDYSSLGPIDPQVRGFPCLGVLSEISKMRTEIALDPSCAPFWQAIIANKYNFPVTECEKSVEWSKALARKWLRRNMLSDVTNSKARIKKIIQQFCADSHKWPHDRRFSKTRCKAAGLKILELETNTEFQDAVLSIHHAFMHTFGLSDTVKIVENHLGNALTESLYG